MMVIKRKRQKIPGHNRHHKIILPSVTNFQERCKSIPREENKSTDEQICPTEIEVF